METIQITAEGPGNDPDNRVCVTCPAEHPFMLGGACDRNEEPGTPGFGPGTTIDTTTYCCHDPGNGFNSVVQAICAQFP